MVLQNAWSAGRSSVGSGLTVAAKVVLLPVHPSMMAVTLTVVVNGDDPPLMAVNTGIFPVPDVPKPISLLLVQLKIGVPPVVEVEKLMPELFDPAQKVWLLIASTTGVGFTLIEKLKGMPSQPDPLMTGCAVTVILATIGFNPGLVPVKAPIFPDPLAANPISG